MDPTAPPPGRVGAVAPAHPSARRAPGAGRTGQQGGREAAVSASTLDEPAWPENGWPHKPTGHRAGRRDAGGEMEKKGSGRACRHFARIGADNAGNAGQGRVRWKLMAVDMAAILLALSLLVSGAMAAGRGQGTPWQLGNPSNGTRDRWYAYW